MQPRGKARTSCHLIINKWMGGRGGRGGRGGGGGETERAGASTLLTESLICSEWTCAWGSRWERLTNTGGGPTEESGTDLHCGERGPMHQRQTGIFILHRGSPSSPKPPHSNLPSRLWKPSIHRTWIRNEIISLPPRALITQPWWLDGAPLSRKGTGGK